jgi:diguanylate cyclase (GGDEF)-like protein
MGGEVAVADETDRRLNQTVGLVIVCGTAAVAYAVFRSIVDSEWLRSSGRLSTLLAVTVMIAVADRAMVRFRIGSHRGAISPTDIAILLGFALLPGHLLVVCTGVAVAVSKVTARSQAKKLAFNSGKSVLVASLTVLTGRLFGIAGPFQANQRMIGGILAAAAVMMAADEAMAVPVVALATRTPIRQMFMTNLDVRVGGAAARSGLAIAVMFLIGPHPAFVAFVPVAIVILHLATGNTLRERSERAAWQKLAQATDEFNEIDMDFVLESAVFRAAELFSADEVEVETRIPHLGHRLLRGDAKKITYDGRPELAPPSEGQVTRTKLQNRDDIPSVGELRLRFRGPVKLTEREGYTLSAYATALCTAIRNAAAFIESKRLAANHEFAATHDALTGLPNRRYLFEAGRDVMEGQPGELTAMLLLDLNHFKEVNDTLGHASGDKVLIEVAARLLLAADRADLVVRLGGDEFAVLMVGLTAPALAVPRARAILAALTEPVKIDNLRLVVEASSGVALAPAQGGVAELLRRADVAMYQAKRDGRSINVYDPTRDTADLSRLSLSAELPRAVAAQEFIVEFQPVVDLGTGVVVSAEALARWRHPEHGDLAPGRFLSALERSSLLTAFSRGVFQQALKAAATWRAEGFLLPVAVNVSPRSLLDPDFPNVVKGYLDEAGVPPEGLIIELTESLTLSQLDVVDDVLCGLDRLGIMVALDDFGTGYSSLATLARVRIHELKIDRGFVAGMEAQAEAAVVRSTIELGRSLDMVVIAEGVESEVQRQRLWEMGCLAGQGHLFARPMPAEQLLSTLVRGYNGRRGAVAAGLHESGAVIRLPQRRPLAQRRDELG